MTCRYILECTYAVAEDITITYLFIKYLVKLASCWNYGFQNSLSGPAGAPTPIYTPASQQSPLPHTHIFYYSAYNFPAKYFWYKLQYVHFSFIQRKVVTLWFFMSLSLTDSIHSFIKHIKHNLKKSKSFGPVSKAKLSGSTLLWSGYSYPVKVICFLMEKHVKNVQRKQVNCVGKLVGFLWETSNKFICFGVCRWRSPSALLYWLIAWLSSMSWCADIL